MLLTGDIGGTHTRLALFAPDARTIAFDRTVLNRDFPDFEAALERFVADAGRPHVSSAALAVAGPVLDGRVRMTNIGWTLDAAALSHRLGGARMRLLNDLEAAAYGTLRLGPDETRIVADAPGATRGNVAVIAAGTGLGEALLTWHGDVPIVIASEGGHADFAPRDATEIALLEWLGRNLGHVSWERVVSGPGILSIYKFLRDSGRADEPVALRDRLAAAHDASAAITESAIAEEFPLCVRTLELFVGAYGAEAGNLALKGLAHGGVWVAGGIAPHVLDGRWRDRFLQAFVDKGRYGDLMRSIAVRVALSDRTALLGAAVAAAL